MPALITAPPCRKCSKNVLVCVTESDWPDMGDAVRFVCSCGTRRVIGGNAYEVIEGDCPAGSVPGEIVRRS